MNNTIKFLAILLVIVSLIFEYWITEKEEKEKAKEISGYLDCIRRPTEEGDKALRETLCEWQKYLDDLSLKEYELRNITDETEDVYNE